MVVTFGRTFVHVMAAEACVLLLYELSVAVNSLRSSDAYMRQ